MRMVRDNAKLSVLLLCFLAIASRVGFIASAWLLLIHKFDMNPLLAGTMSVLIQGFTVAMRPISEALFRKICVRKSQLLGSLLGVLSSMSVIMIDKLMMFLVAVLVASISKVLLESTFPKITYQFVLLDNKFSSTLTGVQQGSVLFISALIAPIALKGFYIIPMLLTVSLYFLTFLVALRSKYDFSSEKEDSEDLLKFSQDQINRRFDDIIKNDLRTNQNAKIHRLRRVPNTLLCMDMSINIINGSALMLMPLCFLEISEVSQGMDSTLCFI